MSSIAAQNKAHLLQLIVQSIASEGTACSLNHIDVSGIQDMQSLFEGSPFNGDIANWDVSAVQDMSRMFEHSAFNGDISKWDVSQVRFACQMFQDSPFSGDVSAWRFDDLLSCAEMFKNSPIRSSLEHWRVPSDSSCDDFVDDAALPTMAAPTFYHWRRALEGAPVLDAHPAWSEHFKSMRAVMEIVGVSRKNEAIEFIHKAWMDKQAPLDTLSLPSLE